MSYNNLPDDLPDDLPEVPGIPDEFLDIVTNMMSRPCASYNDVYSQFEDGKSLNEVLAWHCLENLEPAFPFGLESAKAALAAVMTRQDTKLIRCPCGNCDKMGPADHTADLLVLQPFVRFLAAQN